jgi:protein involved in polysaccharide export with SLBB domain
MTPQISWLFTVKSGEKNMRRPVTLAHLIDMNPNKCSRMCVHVARLFRIACFLAAGIVTLYSISGIAANGQEMPAIAAMQSTTGTPADDDGMVSTTSSPAASSMQGEDSDSNSGDDSNDSTSLSTTVPSAPLSADQITSILEQNPDLDAEVKSQLADRMQQQGIQINANDISDDMLSSQIAANPQLRASISTVLRARGYVADGDLQSEGATGTESNAADSQSPSQRFASSGDSAGAATTDARFGIMQGSTAMGGSGNPATATQSSRSNNNRQLQMGNPRSQERANASTDAPKVVKERAPYDLPSMRDLYAQIPNETASLKRFGSAVFANRDAFGATTGISGADTPLDVPLGPDYVLGPGDELTIHLWGGTTQSITRTIDRDGSVFLPEAGSIDIAGLPLGKAQSVIESSLMQQFRNAQVAVTVSRLRSVRVYLVGDVQRPGGYDISSLSTPVSALYTAGGPTAAGSLRTLRHYRGEQLVEEVDLYDFLLHGIRKGSAPFESGDTLLVPPAGPLVAVSGAVKRPAIYELKAGETTLATVIDDAGGFTAAASLSHIRIERIDANHQRETVTLPDSGNQSSQPDNGAISKFLVKDGDRVRIDPILPYSQRAIYLAGHVVRPGRLAFTDGMRLSDVLRSYQDMLPEPAVRGEIVRLISPDLHAETIDFNVPDVLIGNANIDLQPFDTVRIFGRYQVDAPVVTVRGEVLRPGKYPMSQGMTAAQLVRMAGGFKRDALTESADLTSYDVTNGEGIVENLTTVQIGAALSGADRHADVVLKPGDILAVHQITNWANIGESVTITGQVRYPGSYGFQDGERLSSVLRRAGNFLPTAYPMGAVLIRTQVKELEQKSRDELVRQIETNSAEATLSPSLASSGGATELQAIKAQQNQVIADLKNHPPTGRMVIHISADIDSWANTPADIELRRGDVLTIPKRPGFVLVSGEVYNATALTFTPGKTAAWYLSRAGGTNGIANRKEVFIIRANGSVIGRHSGGWFDADVLSTRLNPGDVVVVPEKVIGGSLFWRNLLSTGQLAASIAITSGIAVAAL